MSDSIAGQEIGAKTELREMAYLHEPYWRSSESDWIKSLLLFFDGVALLVPDYMRATPLLSDASLAQPLADQGLLVRLSPETLVDQETTEALTDLLVELLATGAFDHLDRNSVFPELSYSRLGGHADAGLTEIVIEELMAQGLARPSHDGVSVPLHPTVRAFILVALPQLLRAPAESAGYALQPSSGNTPAIKALLRTLGLVSLPTSGHVVALDLEQVTLDLGPVPLDEVLDFRLAHGAEHRAYARDLRRFIRELASLDQDSRDRALTDRREELADTADQLRRLARTSWRRPLATFGLGIAGSAVTFATGNPLVAGITAAGALLGLRRQADPASAYSYLFRAEEHLTRA